MLKQETTQLKIAVKRSFSNHTLLVFSLRQVCVYDIDIPTDFFFSSYINCLIKYLLRVSFSVVKFQNDDRFFT